jgi:hypothetical protein
MKMSIATVAAVAALTCAPANVVAEDFTSSIANSPEVSQTLSCRGARTRARTGPLLFAAVAATTAAFIFRRVRIR